MPDHHPEFILNMIMNFAFVVGQTIGVRLVMRCSYNFQFLSNIIPLIIIMAAFPFMIQYTHENSGWYLMNASMVIIGKCLLHHRIGYCLGLLSSINIGLAGQINPYFVGAVLQGIALSYVIVDMVKFICLLAFPEQGLIDMYYATLLFFGLNIIILLCQSISIPFFLKSKFIQYHLSRSKIQVVPMNAQESAISVSIIFTFILTKTVSMFIKCFFVNTTGQLAQLNRLYGSDQKDMD